MAINVVNPQSNFYDFGQNKRVSVGYGKKSPDDFMAMLREKTDEMEEKLRNGDTEEKFAIGSSMMTIKEWDKLLEEVDKSEDELKEAMEAEIEERVKDQEEKELLEKHDKQKATSK